MNKRLLLIAGGLLILSVAGYYFLWEGVVEPLPPHVFEGEDIFQALLGIMLVPIGMVLLLAKSFEDLQKDIVLHRLQKTLLRFMVFFFVIHVLLVLLVAVVSELSGEPMLWLLFITVDFPIGMTLLDSNGWGMFEDSNFIAPLVMFGIVGSLWWLCMGCFFGTTYASVRILWLKFRHNNAPQPTL